ncbi:MAG: hypothetical protein R3281_10345, partial [Balneolaceae bacterium]|nr:hypothetical protein [Balneolaceae bacterium]
MVLIPLTLTLAWWSYRDFRSVRSPIRYGLILLRGTTFLLLLLLLLNPLFRSETTRFERPSLMVMFDNSSSVSVNKGEYRGTDSYRAAIERLNFPGIDRFNFRYYAFDGDVAPGHPDSLTLDGSQTNLHSAVEVIRNNQRDVRAALLFSDGIFNQGRNPVFLSRELDLPVFTVALGDTSRLKDLVIRNIVTNATGYLNT